MGALVCGMLVLAGSVFGQGSPEGSTVGTASGHFDLVAHWRFDEVAGSVAHDLTGQYDGRVSSTGAQFVVEGVAGRGIHFDRNQDGMMVAPPIVGLFANDFSVVTWAKLPAGDTTPFTWLFSLHEAWFANGLLLLLNEYSPGQQYSAPGKASLIINDGYHSLTSKASINDGKWHQIAFTYQKNGVTSIYVDGQPSGAVTSQPTIADRSAPVVIGGLYGNETTGVPKGYYTGWVDDVQVYRGALSAGEIGELFEQPGKNLPELDRELVVWPKSGAYTNAVSVTMTTSIASGVVRYTLDGTEPVATSAEYSGAMTVDRTCTFKARAFVNGNPASEVVSASYLFPSRVDLAAHWRFDESSGLVAHDLTGQYDGKVSPTGAEFVGEAVAGGGIQFDRAKDGMMVAPPIGGLFTNDFSVVTWAKLPAGDTTPFTWLFSLHETWVANGLLLLLNEYSPGQEYSAPGKASLIINDGYHSLTSKASINDGKWHQIAFTYEKNGVTSIYVDGQPSGSVASQPTIVDRLAPVVIGGLYGNVTTGVPKGYYTGWVDDVQVYRGALNLGEVAVLFERVGANLIELTQPLAIWPRTGIYTNFVNVTMTTSSGENEIRYTTDGSDPVGSSPLFTGQLKITSSATVKAMAFQAGQPVSGAVSANYSVVPGGPVITKQPEDQVARLGEEARFVVSATGRAPLSYQWRKDGNPITGATDPTLILTGCKKSDEGTYTVLVTDSTGQVSSSTVSLLVKDWILSVRLFPGLLLQGTSGDRFVIQYVTDLAMTNAWIDLARVTLTNSFVFWVDMDGTTQQRFYRAIPAP